VLLYTSKKIAMDCWEKSIEEYIEVAGIQLVTESASGNFYPLSFLIAISTSGELDSGTNSSVVCISVYLVWLIPCSFCSRQN
jgi:hypothetical protein